MGRLADARRRARQRTAAAPPPDERERVAPDAAPAEDAGAPPTPAPAAGTGRGPLAADPATESGPPDADATRPADDGGLASRAEGVPVALQADPGVPGAPGDTLVFPDDEGHLPARYVLPSSGLAEEVLAVAASAPEPGGEVAAAEAAAAQARATRAHQFTFLAAPERDAREQVEASEHLVTFVVGDEEYGVDVHLVQEIIRVPAVTAVPRAPDFVRGVINLRGRIIPVIDLKTKLGLGRVDGAQRRARVVVVRLKGRFVGLLVDGASQVLKVPASVIEAAPEEVVEIESHFLRGVAKLGGRLIILVDLLEVLAPELRAEGAAP